MTEQSSSKLVQLKERFLRGSAERLSDLTRGLELVLADRNDREASEDLKRRFHSLAGLAGTHGYHQITAIAREAELCCQTWLAGTRTADEQDVLFVSEAIERLRAEFATVVTAVRQEEPSAPTGVA